jgi:hypothetical protein
MKTNAARLGSADAGGKGEEAKRAPEEMQDCRLAQHAAPLQTNRRYLGERF